MRGQGALEYMIIIAAVLGISAVVVLFITGVFTGSTGGADLSKCRLAAANCQRDLTLGLGTSCMQCEAACKGASGKDLLDGTTGACGLACQQCKQGTPVGGGSGLAIGLAGYWNFEEGVGTVVRDGSGNANHGTYSGEVFNDGTLTNGPTRTAGKYGNALRFDGLNDYVQIPNSLTLNPVTTLTISAWVNITSFAAHSPIVDKYTYLGGGYILVISSSQYLAFRADNGAATQEIITPYTYLNSWHHVAATFNSTHVKLYIDGNEVASQSNSIGIILANSYNVRAGFTTSGYYQAYANAVIDSIRMLNKSLNQSEIRAEMDSSRSVLRAVGTWEFNEGSGSLAEDTHIWVAGKSGAAVSFDGINDNIAVPYSSSWQPKNLTVSFWIYPQAWLNPVIGSPPHWAYPISDGFGIVSSTTAWSWWIRTSAGRQMDSASNTDMLNKWNHLALTYEENSGDMKFYINGNFINTRNLGAGTPIAWSTSSLYMGGVPSYRGIGLIDDFRIYSRALAAPEIASLYSSP
jgi:hypothetical protein